MDEKVLKGIRKATTDAGYNDEFAGVLCRAYEYIQTKGLQGACHAMSAALYVAFSEMGYYPVLCVGEVQGPNLLFDHSWLMMFENKLVIDIAICNTLDEKVQLAPVVFGVDVITKKPPILQYGVKGAGLDETAQIATSVPFSEYMDVFPYEKNGLWDVVAYLLDENLSEELTEGLRLRYSDTEWEYIRR